MRRWLRRLALLAASLAAVLLLVALALVALSRGWQRERVRALAETLLTRAVVGAGLVDARVRLGALDGPLYPDLVLRKVALELPNSTPLRVESVEVRLDLSQLVRERLAVVESLRARGAELELARGAEPDARWPWQRVEAGAAEEAAGAAAPRPFALELRRFELTQARVDVAWSQAGSASRLRGRLDAALDDVVLPRAGTPAWPRHGEAGLELEPSSVAGRALHGAELALALDGSRLHVARARLDSEFGRARATGDADLAGWLDAAQAAALDGEMEVEALDLGVALARADLAGAVAASVSLHAARPAGAPASASRVEASLRLDASRVGPMRIEAGALRGTFEEGRWSVAQAMLDASFARVRAHGSGDLESAEALDLDVDVHDLAPAGALFGVDASGMGRARAALRGRWSALAGTVDLDATQIRVDAVELHSLALRGRASGDGRWVLDPLALDAPPLRVHADGPVRLRLGEDRIVFERARLRSAEGDTLALSGAVSRTAVSGLEIETSSLPLTRLAALAGEARPLPGAIRMKLVANGPLPRPGLRGTVEWIPPADAPLGIETVRLEVSATSGRELRAEGQVRAGDRDLVDAALRTPWRTDVDPRGALASPATSLAIRGDDLDLALAQPFLPAGIRRLQGKARLRLDLRGGAPQPALDGEVEIAQAFFRVDALGRTLGPLDARLLLGSESVRVESLRVGAGKIGSATVGGEVFLADLVPQGVDLRISLAQFPLRMNDVLRARLNGSIDCVGRFGALAAGGDLVLNELRYTLAPQPDPLLAEIMVRDAPAQGERRLPSTPPPDLLAGATIDVRLDVPAESRLKGQGADVAFAGALRAFKQPQRPLVLLGQIDTTSGSYRLRGKTFLLERGRITFTARADFDPELDVLAAHRLRDVRILAHITGRASSPRIRLESEPPYPEADVLSLLLFGRTRDQLGQAQASALGTMLAGTAGGAALGELEDLIHAPVPIDTFEVESSESGDDVTIGVGRYVGDRVYVRYGQAFGTTDESQVRIEWRLAPRWSVESNVSSSGASSADLIWTFDY